VPVPPRVASLLILALAVRAGAVHGATPPANDRKVLLVVLDGLRPDYVAPERMPNLHAVAGRGVWFTDHHSVFPTVTRVNASSMATGAFPAKHGLLGNTVYFPQVAPRGLNTSEARNLMEIEKATGGRLLSVPSLGEILEQAGRTLLVGGSGSGGAAYLLNHKVRGAGILNVDVVLPEALRDRARTLGPVPPEASPNAARNRWAVDALLEVGWAGEVPDVTMLWLSDPDHTAHARGIGAPATDEALRLVDGELGRVLAAVEARGLRDRVDVLVASDHGFSTHRSGTGLAQLLVQAGLKESPDSDDVLVVEGAIYVKDHDRARIERIVRALQAAPAVGAVFTEGRRPGKSEGVVSGTLSFETARWNHERRADILVAPAWSDDRNAHGYAGTTMASGTAGHGGSGAWDVHATLVAAGPDFKSGIESGVPTGNGDLAPTICRLLGVPRPASMEGRAIEEALRGGPAPAAVKVSRRTHAAQTKLEAGTVRLEMRVSEVDRVVYMDYTRTTRSAARRGGSMP
jgi:arylsulfatase A-like enzyme